MLNKSDEKTLHMKGTLLRDEWLSILFQRPAALSLAKLLKPLRILVPAFLRQTRPVTSVNAILCLAYFTKSICSATVSECAVSIRTGMKSQEI
jgi:hypothetical protein